jgi:Flp pilus assembly protein TadB
MAPTPKKRARDANGRFVTRRAANERSEGREGVGPLALVSVAIVLGVAGFAWHFVWIAALVVLGILWGSLAAERQRRSRSGKGVLAEVVDVVVEQAKDVADSAQSKPTKRESEN